MKRIILMCNAGMSTSMLVSKMREAAEAQDYACTIEACPVSDLNAAAGADVILLGPQVRFQLSKVQKAYPDIPVDAISPMDYGMVKGDHVLKAARKLRTETI